MTMYKFNERQVDTASWMLNKLNEFKIDEIGFIKTSYDKRVSRIVSDFLISAEGDRYWGRQIDNLILYTPTGTIIKKHQINNKVFGFFYDLSWKMKSSSNPIALFGKNSDSIMIKSIMEIVCTGQMSDDVRIRQHRDKGGFFEFLRAIGFEIEKEENEVMIAERNSKKVHQFISLLVDEYSFALREEISSLALVVESLVESSASEGQIQKARMQFGELLSIPVLDVMDLTLSPNSSLNEALLIDPGMLDDIVTSAKDSYEDRSLVKKISESVDKFIEE